jgi:two-component system cell cycle sensor histidine kinase/response regulator CckA
MSTPDRTTPDQLRTALAASEARFRALFENAADFTLIASPEGRLMQVSPSITDVLGYSPDELVGRIGFDFVDPDDVPAMRDFLGRVIANRGVTHGPEFRAVDASGTWHVLEPTGLNLFDDPAVDGLVYAYRDVTERRDLERRVRQMERLEAVGQLAGGIAHDFNNILLVIRGYSNMLQSALGDSELAADVNEIAKAADRAAEMTRQLLAFARRQVLKPVAVDLREIVIGIEKLLRRSVREDVELQFDVEQEVSAVLADPSQIERVLVNLVVNARDAMPTGGRLAISIAPAVLEAGAPVSPPLPPGVYAALTVTDTGCGIEEADLPYVFEPFYTTKEEASGTGLGLSTVYGIVAQSGGGIEVAARPGGGTRMTVYLPAADSDVVLDEGGPEPLGPPVGKETILLVEDEDPVRDLVRRVLEDAGYEVLPAALPSEAQRLAAGARIDLLLTDVVMPEMSGYDLASRIAIGQPTARTLFISGYAHRALGEASELPAGELLRKPFSPEQLTRAVRIVLDGGHRLEIG